MPLSADSHQEPVSLDGSAIISRVVYGKLELRNLQIQVGYVSVDFARIPVWRHYDPEDVDWAADWQRGTFKNIYTLKPKKRNPDGPIWLKLGPVEFDGREISLPLVDVLLTPDLQKHIQGLT